MKSRITLALLGTMAVGSLLAQTPSACIGLTMPLRPIGTVACSNAVPVCLMDPNGQNGRWIWSCNNTPSPPQPQIDPSVPQGIMHPATPQISDPLDTAIMAQQLRQLRLQNEQMQQQIRDAAVQGEQLWQLQLKIQQLEQQLRQSNAPTAAPSPTPSPGESSSSIPQPGSAEGIRKAEEFWKSVKPLPPDGTNWQVMKYFEKSMALWHQTKPSNQAQKNAIREMDRFYAEPANLNIPVADAFANLFPSLASSAKR